MTTNRRTGAVSAAALSGLVALFGLAQAIAPAWAERLGLDVWNVPSFRESIRQSEDDWAALLGREERLHHEIEAANHLAARLAAGTITLAEATRELEPQLAARTGFDCVCKPHYGASTFRQAVARNLMVRVESLLRDDPDRWAAVACGLEGEYAALE